MKEPRASIKPEAGVMYKRYFSPLEQSGSNHNGPDKNTDSR